MTTPARSRYAGHRFPPEVIGHALWLYFRFPLSLRMVEEMLAARGILVSHETVRQWGLKFGQAFANQIRRRLPGAGDKWHLDEVVITIAGKRHRLWRAVARRHRIPEQRHRVTNWAAHDAGLRARGSLTQLGHRVPKDRASSIGCGAEGGP